MYITQETDYAIRIVYCLAKSGARRDARSISEEMCISLRFALKILGKLAQGGLVSSFKGNRGGYELARSAKDISLKDVIDVVEGPWRLTRCADDSAACNRSAHDTCAFRREMCRISQRINEELAAVNFAALAAKK